jgi:hypothetical protein
MRAIFQLSAESVEIADWVAERSGFEPSTPTSPFHREIVREFGGEL